MLLCNMDKDMEIEWERMLLDPVHWYNTNICSWQGSLIGFSPPRRDSSQYQIIIEYIVDYFFNHTGIAKETLRIWMLNRIPSYLKLN